jgi:hypothetical protein
MNSTKKIIAQKTGDGVRVGLGLWFYEAGNPDLGYFKDYVEVYHDKDIFATRREREAGHQESVVWTTKLNWSALGSQDLELAQFFAGLMAEAVVIAQWFEDGTLDVERALVMFAPEAR